MNLFSNEMLLTTMTFAPALGALLILFVPRNANAAVKWIRPPASVSIHATRD